MLTTTRRDKRNRRQASLTLESLDERLVLSAAAAGAAAEAVSAKAEAVEARHEAKLARGEARHEAKLARVDARHEAKLAARAAAHPTSSASVAIPITASASASATTATSASATASPTAATAAPVSGGTVTPNETRPRPLPVPATISQTSSSGSTSQTSSSPLPSNVAGSLQSLYTEFEGAGTGSFQPSQPNDALLQISGNNVEVSIKVGSGTDFATALAQLQSDGMQVSNSSSGYDLIQGMLPISELPAAAQIASSVTPISPPLMN